MTSPYPADTVTTPAQRVSLQFADRPTFERVVQDMLELTLKEKYPSRAIDLTTAQFATVDASSRGPKLQPFMPLVLDYLSLGTPVDFLHEGTLVNPHLDSIAGILLPVQRLDMTVVETLVHELPWTVPIGLEDALTRYWNDDIDTRVLADTHNSNNRWRWLSNELKNELHLRALQQPGLTVPAHEALDQIIHWPDREQRFSHNSPPVYAYSLESIVTQGASSAVLPSNELLLLHFTQYGLVVLLCSPGKAVQSFESMEAFLGHWSEHIASRYAVDTVICQRSEISGNAFDTQAAMILEQQLADLRAVQLPSRIGLQNLSTLYQELSDPARYLLDAPRPTPEALAQIGPLLPEWIKRASVVDQTTFQRYSLALAGAKKRSEGRTFLSDITDIRTFTADTLLKHMEQANDSSPDKAHPSQYQLDDVELTFTVVAGLPAAPGISEKIKMSLTELAIKNLVAKPQGHLKLSHRRGLTLPEWLTPDFITRKGGLIEQVDIGKTYPRYLQQRLFDDLPQAQERERLFAEQIPAQLVLDALKRMLNNENGMTRQGLALIETLLEPDADGQQVNGRPVVIRHLAFLREPESAPDIVSNMFIIEPQDLESGPHLLYAPLYAQSLLEFPTRQALFQAIATPGKLQNSVLTWMSDNARQVYSLGGFLVPRIVRFFQGDEFSPPENPAPATLAIDGINGELLQYLHNGKLMQYLYGSNVQALVTQADRDSVSNRESRWAVFREGASLLFSTLLMLPLLPGPLLTAAWLVSLIGSVGHDIPALNSEDPVERELAAVDLLINLVMLVGHFSSTSTPTHTPLSETLKAQAMRPPAPRAIPEQWPASAPPRIVDGPVTLPGEQSETSSKTVLFTPSEQKNIQLQRLQLPLPTSLPEPVRSGLYKGLYAIGNKWCALVDGLLYEVAPQSPLSAMIVDPLDPARNGPMLQADEQGNWSIDRRLHLAGGMPFKRMDKLRRSTTQRRIALVNELEAHLAQQEDDLRAVETARDVMKRVQDGNYKEELRAQKRTQYLALLKEQTDGYLKLLDSNKERADLEIPLSSETIRLLMANVVQNARAAVAVVTMDLEAYFKTHGQFTNESTVFQAIRADVQGYLKYLNRLIEVTDRQIYWLELRDSYLEKLANRGSAGRQEVKRLNENRPQNESNAIVVKSLQITTLPELTIKHFSSDLADALHGIVKPLIEQMRSHSDLRTYEVLPSEQLEVLETLSEHYGRALDALQGVKTLYADDIDKPHFDKLFEQVNSLYQDVSQQLAAEEIKAQTESGDAAPASETPTKIPQNTRVKNPRKKVIRTRKNGVLIGDMKPAGEDPSLEIVELRSQSNNEQVLATYSLHGDVWDVIETAPPTRPIRPAQTRLVNEVMGDGEQLLSQLEKRLRDAESYTAHCRFPQEIEEIMNIEVNRFRKVSQELDRAFTASQSPRTPADQQLTPQTSDTVQKLAQELSDAISSLTTRSRELRTQRSLELPPTGSNLQYLLEQKILRVAPPGERIALTGPRQDFLQEYAITYTIEYATSAASKGKNQALWYAHFHYETVNIPKGFYTAAHLKLKEQRYDGAQSKPKGAESIRPQVSVYRAPIGKFLAQNEFLPLAP